MKKIWSNLTKEERTEYMMYQMSPSSGGYGYNLPDDASECGVCGSATLGYGWCNACHKRFSELSDKLEEIKK